MTNWNEIHAFLQPKEPLFCPETPSTTQKVFLRTNAKEVFFGGAAGGGKSSALLMAALQYVDIPHYSAMLFSRTYADLALPGRLMDRFLEWMEPYEDVRWNGNNFSATFPSGARITFGYLNNKEDYLRYKSAEFQYVGMDEVTEIREKDYRYLFSRLRKPARGPLSQVPLRMRSASNPAPNWVRQRFIVEGKKEGRIFIPSFLTDNPGIDPESYLEMLQEVDPIERLRLVHGDWWASGNGSMFAKENFVIIGDEKNPIPYFSEDTKFIRYWDMASTEITEEDEKEGKDADYTVGTLMAEEGGRFYILDVKRERFGPAKVEKLIAQTALEDGPHVAIRMEQEPGSSGVNLGDHYARNVLKGYVFDYKRVTGDKKTRAKPYAAAVANGNVLVVRADWNTPFFDEHTSFPEETEKEGMHDDQVDSASGAFSFLAGLDQKARRPIEIIV